MNMVTADPAPGAGDDGGTGCGNRLAGHRGPYVLRRWSLCAVLLSIAVAGCARNVPEHDVSPAAPEVKATPARSAAPPRRHVQIRYIQPKIRKPDAALLAPQPPPDCEFKRSDLRTVDPAAWARLKAEYELQCYQEAERAARRRLLLLQEASTCEIEPTGRKAPLRKQSMQLR